MYQDSTSLGTEYQFNTDVDVLGVHYVHNHLVARLKTSARLVNGDEVYVIGNPGGGIAARLRRPRVLTKPFATPKAKSRSTTHSTST